MKHLLLLTALLGYLDSRGQNVNLVLDTIQYANIKYYEGQKIRLGQGTDEKKEFTHIKTGKNIDSLIPLPSFYANKTITIQMVYKNDHGFVIVAAPLENSENKVILIRVEQALSSKELMLPTPVSKEALGKLAVM